MILVVIAIYVVMGFTLAWIAGMVAREEVEVKTGVLVLFLAGIVAGITEFLIAAVNPVYGLLCTPVVYFGALMLMLHLIASMSWKHSAIISAIYSALVAALLVGLSSCSS